MKDLGMLLGQRVHAEFFVLRAFILFLWTEP